MQIGSTLLKAHHQISHSNQTSSQASVQSEAAPKLPNDSFTFAQERTPAYVKAGKYALAAATTTAAGALAYYAGTNVGTAATIAGAVSGALAGATVLGTVGLMADIGGGFFSNSNNTLKAASVGGALGLLGGGYVGAAVQSPVLGTIMGLASGVSALALTGAATNILAK